MRVESLWGLARYTPPLARNRVAAIGKVGSALMKSVIGSGESRGDTQSELVRSIQAQNHVRKHREEEPVSGMINLSLPTYPWLVV